MKKSFVPRIVSFSWFLSAAGCAQGMQINEYPIESPGGAGCVDLDGTSPSKYWSAYVRLESANIPQTWNTSSLDYILITANAKIPTRNGPLVRDFPLFTIKDGQVQSQSGVDLLKKIPLSDKARDQVSITIEVRFIRKKRAMDVVQKILKEVTRVAEPYLNSYPIASQIVGSAIPLIDQLAPNEKTAPSSTTTLVVPEELGGERKLVAFTLVPLSSKGEDSRAKLDGLVIRECPNMPGALCQKKKGESGAAAGGSNAQTRPADVAATVDRLGRLKMTLMASYRGKPSGSGDNYDQQAWTMFKELVKVAAPDVETLDLDKFEYWDLERLLDGFIEAYKSHARRSLAQAGAGWTYQDDRLKELVYLTVNFRGYDRVFDPMILLRDALSDCAQITSTSIQQARDYLSANEDLFAPEDVDLAKRTFRLGGLLLSLRERSAKRSHDEILALFEAAQPRPGFYTVAEDAPGKPRPDDLQRHHAAVSRCLADAATAGPADTLRKIWQLTRDDARLGSPALGIPQEVGAEIFRLDLLEDALVELAAITGQRYSVEAEEPFPKLSSPLVHALHLEVKRLYKLQPSAPGACKDANELKRLAGHISLACERCWTDLQKACSADVTDARGEIAKLRAARRQLVDRYFAVSLTFEGDAGPLRR